MKKNYLDLTIGITKKIRNFSDPVRNFSDPDGIETKELIEYYVEITENCEDDKFHVVVYEVYSDQSSDHYSTLGFPNEKEVYNFLKVLKFQNE